MEEIFRRKLNMVTYPTAFHELKNLRKKLNSNQNIYIKRDDCTEMGLGGNKSRKLDYIMYEALYKNCDTVITVGGSQSNHCRQTLAFANSLGLECHLILNGEKEEAKQGNLFLFDLMGAKITYIEDKDDFNQAAEELKRELEIKGRKPYIIPLGASVPLGSIAYIDSLKEIAVQGKERDLNIKHIFLATGSAGTQAGLELGCKMYLPKCKVHGVSVGKGALEMKSLVSDLANQTAKFIGKDFLFNKDDICVHDQYYGQGYAVPSNKGNQAVKTVAKEEGIILDPVYTGKAMSGLIDMLKKDEFKQGEDIVFLHTGGSPAIFNFTGSFK